MRLVISDWGGVVVDNADSVPSMAAELKMTATAFRALTADDTRLLLAGAISATEFWARFRQKTGQDVDEELWGREFRPVLNPAVLALLARVRQRVRVVAGTNTMDPHWPALQESGLFASFDAVYASHQMGLVKPEPDFYQRILDEERCDPSDALFFDDLPENVAGALRVGIHALRFCDPESFEVDLRSFGLLDGGL